MLFNSAAFAVFFPVVTLLYFLTPDRWRWALVLAAFKYYDFLAANLTAAAASFGVSAALPLLRMALPIGLSFHTFHAMAYTIGVYRREVPAERHLGIYALYVMFYPQLVAGP